MENPKESFTLELMGDIKNYYQMPACWSDKERTFSIGIGYCPSCDAIKATTNYRRRFLGNDCNGPHYETDTVPLQCSDSYHKGAIKFSSLDFDSFLKKVQFLKDHKETLEDVRFKEGKAPNVGVNNRTYKIFRDLVDSWGEKEIRRMYNPDFINTEEFAKLVEDYERWHSLGKRNQIQDIKFLHESSLESQVLSKQFEEDIAPLKKIL